MTKEQTIEGLITTQLLSGKTAEFITQIKMLKVTPEEASNMELFGDPKFGQLLSKIIQDINTNKSYSDDMKDLVDYTKASSKTFSDDNSVDPNTVLNDTKFEEPKGVVPTGDLTKKISDLTDVVKSITTATSGLIKDMHDIKSKTNFSVDGNSEAFKSGKELADSETGLDKSELDKKAGDAGYKGDDLINFKFGYNSVDKKAPNIGSDEDKNMSEIEDLVYSDIDAGITEFSEEYDAACKYYESKFGTDFSEAYKQVFAEKSDPSAQVAELRSQVGQITEILGKVTSTLESLKGGDAKESDHCDHSEGDGDDLVYSYSDDTYDYYEPRNYSDDSENFGLHPYKMIGAAGLGGMTGNVIGTGVGKVGTGVSRIIYDRKLKGNNSLSTMENKANAYDQLMKEKRIMGTSKLLGTGVGALTGAGVSAFRNRKFAEGDVPSDDKTVPNDEDVVEEELDDGTKVNCSEVPTIYDLPDGCSYAFSENDYDYYFSDESEIENFARKPSPKQIAAKYLGKQELYKTKHGLKSTLMKRAMLKGYGKLAKDIGKGIGVTKGGAGSGNGEPHELTNKERIANAKADAKIRKYEHKYAASEGDNVDSDSTDLQDKINTKTEPDADIVAKETTQHDETKSKAWYDGYNTAKSDPDTNESNKDQRAKELAAKFGYDEKSPEFGEFIEGFGNGTNKAVDDKKEITGSPSTTQNHSFSYVDGDVATRYSQLKSMFSTTDTL